MKVENLSSLTWLLPAASIGLLLYIGAAIVGGTLLDVPLWLILLFGLPAVMLLWLALTVALIDVTQRPKAEITDEARVIWVLLLAILNVLAFLPYWLVVVRRHRQPAGEPGA